MVFASIPFLLLFLPAVLFVYLGLSLVCTWASPSRRATVLNAWLVAASLVFYVSGAKGLGMVMYVTATTDFLAALVISGAWRGGEPVPLPRNGPRTALQRTALVIAIATNLGLLAFFKYAGFGLANLSLVLDAFGVDTRAWSALDLTLPLGISFYTFQSMSYTLDVYDGEVTATRSFLDFACLVSMFPHLVAGPIIRYRNIGAQLRGRRLTMPLFASGVRRFIVGLGKKALVANSVAAAVDRIFDLPALQMTQAAAWAGAALYGIQIYFDFSGYSDMAIGLGRMFGFEFQENFAHPYAADSLTDFWRRWHISLSTWFRDYLYLRLGGNRRGAATTYRNLLVVFLLCGLWHGAQWTFVLWGLYHGSFLIAERVGLQRIMQRAPRFVRHAYTLLVVLVGWILFRSSSFAGAAVMLKAMAGQGAPGGLAPVAVYLTATTLMAAAAGSACSLPLLAWVEPRLGSRPEGDARGPTTALDLAWRIVGTAAHAAVLAASLMWLAGGTYNPFIYFRF